MGHWVCFGDSRGRLRRRLSRGRGAPAGGRGACARRSRLRAVRRRRIVESLNFRAEQGPGRCEIAIVHATAAEIELHPGGAGKLDAADLPARDGDIVYQETLAIVGGLDLFEKRGLERFEFGWIFMR